LTPPSLSFLPIFLPSFSFPAPTSPITNCST
jgi:hypothetical protein